MKYDQIIVIDIESTCWKDDIPQGQISEIIEVGVSPLDISTGSILQGESIIVKPMYSEVSEFCTELTGFTQEDVDKGITFEDACNILIDKYLTQKRVWASYGNYDRKQFEGQTKMFGVRYPFSDLHINVKNIFAVMNGLKKEVGMAKALNKMGLSLDGTHHRGYDDACNISKILSGLILDMRKGKEKGKGK